MHKIIVSFILLGAITLAPQINLPREIIINGITESAIAQEIPPFETEAQAMVAYDAVTNTPVITYGKDMIWPIASLTKMMSAIVFYEQNPNLKENITLEKGDMVGGAMIKVPVETKLTANDLVHATLMVSANNAAHALYKATPLSLDEFVEKMNERARALGLEDTHFTDTTGLSPNNISTPEEYTHVMKAALEVPEIRKIMSKRSHVIQPAAKRSFTIGNTNKFLEQETGFTVIGAKTGLLNESGFNLAVQAKKNDKEMMVVVFGNTSFENAFRDAQKLLDKAFEKPVTE
jgi:D-alanyl-D-alanine endopeptidase (penicillin-binding protein 7)